ncbi:GvpL/GvpF family gas vesicle protein [Kibdelosporangium philippinense]|uniref:GvpL/GvpF family gas vesicle protein n=1 Tax=Kibdelosporangium philippinense TaxID=211113 RepID=A0ABS8Z0T4_9PSEU|nr:GvpL/GvpF family gas vesicle protein [Kibdelosporangium philippinense]MCE7001576.1 GvpL/GvpF family gas vesicle protein [Kibdelosporangium philippinense]
MSAEIDLLARQHAPQVLAEALRLARSKAVEVLSERLVNAIIAEALKPYRPPQLESADKGLCVYAITRECEIKLPALRTAVSPRLIAHDGVGAVVADVDLAQFTNLEADPVEDSALATLAREHDAVVRAVFEHEPVLPLRFGTVVTGEQAALDLLRERREEALTWLDRVAGHCEWGVRVESPVPPETSSEGLSGTEYLRHRQSALSRDQDQAKAAQSMHDKLQRQATDAACREQRPHTLLDAAYLVPQDNETSFRDSVTRLSEPLERLGATVHTTGPWPPYSFTRIELAVQQ